MSDCIVIPISGWAGAGKDTFAKFMIEAQPTFKILKYADPLKDMLAFVLGVSREHMDDPVEKVKYRGSMQRLGTEVFREQVDPDWWVLSTYRKVLEETRRGRRVFLIPDTRFPNEIQFWHTKMNIMCLPVRIEREDHEPPNKHISETALDNYKFFKTYAFREGDLKGMREWAAKFAGEIREIIES